MPAISTLYEILQATALLIAHAPTSALTSSDLHADALTPSSPKTLYRAERPPQSLAYHSFSMMKHEVSTDELRMLMQWWLWKGIGAVWSPW